MNEQKGLFTQMGEVLDRYLTKWRVTAQERTSSRRPGWLRWLGRQMVPNIGTLLLVAVLLLTQNVWARPLLGTTTAPGPSATTVNYQGRLADNTGAPLDGSYGMTFALYDATTDGSLVWGPEGHTAVPVSEGLFSVGLGSQTGGGIPTSVWNGDRYLEITVGGETLSPRELIRSVPVAGMALTVPDGAITSRQVCLSNGRLTPSADLNLTDSSQTIPGMSANLSPTTNQTYLFYLVVEFIDSGSTDGHGVAQLYIDGEVAQGGQAALMDWSARLGTISQVYRIDLPVGNHTIEARAHSSNGGGRVWRWHTSLTWLAVSQ